MLSELQLRNISKLFARQQEGLRPFLGYKKGKGKLRAP